MKTAIIIAQLIVLASCAYSQDSTHPSALSTLYTVHIDEVTLSSMQRFEQLDIAQMRARNKILEEHNLPVTPGYALSTSGGLDGVDTSYGAGGAASSAIPVGMSIRFPASPLCGEYQTPSLAE